MPDTYAVASGVTDAPPAEAWERISNLENWPAVFPQWIASIVAEDDRFTATGPSREKYDLYPQLDPDRQAIDVETVDELGSADTLRLRVLPVKGGSLVIVAHGRLPGAPEVAWAGKRDAIAAGLAAL